jgi:hypothetical protein
MEARLCLLSTLMPSLVRLGRRTCRVIALNAISRTSGQNLTTRRDWLGLGCGERLAGRRNSKLLSYGSLERGRGRSDESTLDRVQGPVFQADEALSPLVG